MYTMEPEQPVEDGVVYCSFREIGIILPNKRYYKCIKPDVCCDTGCCNEQNYKFGTVWQYWILMLVSGIAIFGLVRYCCWLCKNKDTPINPRNTLRRSVASPQTPNAPSNLMHVAPPPIIRPVIGGRRAHSSSNVLHGGASVFSLGGPHNSNNSLTRLETDRDDRITEAFVNRERYGLSSVAGMCEPLAYQWGAAPVTGRRGVGARIGGLTEDERLELGIRAIGGNTELTRDRGDQIPTNNTTENGDLALLTQLMALDIIYHSDNNNNNPPNASSVNEKPPDYEQCLNLSSTVKTADVQPPTYDDICHEVESHTISDAVVYSADVTGNVTTTDVNANCQLQNGNMSV